MRPVRNLRVSLLILVLTLGLETAGYIVLEGWDFLDALYMTVITLATVGYKEVHDL
ncbi:MAG: potassium channel family protein, partial [Syntrophotalea acetylenica]|nr:potassium channel family protein [Syntrophotalea acetylenica]